MSSELDQSAQSMDQVTKNKRLIRNIFINPKFQIKYIFFISSSAILLTLMYSFLTYYYVSENYAILIDLSPITDEVKKQLYMELNHLIVSIGIISALFILIVSSIGLILSHRTAGPMYHFKKIFHQISSGNIIARIHLRPKDDFHDVAQSFNEMMDRLKVSKPNE